MFHYRNLLRSALAAIALTGAACGANANGGYLSFPKPASLAENRPLQELDFFFRMAHDPGPTAGAFYAQNFNLLGTPGQPNVSGYMGLQSAAIASPHDKAYALITLWTGSLGQITSMTAGPNVNCSKQSQSAEGSVASCAISTANPIAHNGMVEGDTYRIYIQSNANRVPLTSTGTPVTPLTFQFGIQDLRTGVNTVLATMTIANVLGINALGPSHFLEFFYGQSCADTPYTAYAEEAPIGVDKWGVAHPYSVVPNPDGQFGPCQNNVTFAPGNGAGTVEFGIATPYRAP